MKVNKSTKIRFLQKILRRTVGLGLLCTSATFTVICSGANPNDDVNSPFNVLNGINGLHKDTKRTLVSHVLKNRNLRNLVGISGEFVNQAYTTTKENGNWPVIMEQRIHNRCHPLLSFFRRIKRIEIILANSNLGEEEKAQAKGERSALLRQWGVYSPRFNSEADKKSLRGINPLVHVPQEVGIINFSVIFNSDGFNSDEKDPLHNFPHTMISRMCGGQINPNEGEFEGYPLQFTCPLRIPYIFISIDVCSDTMEDDGYEGYYMGVDFNTYEGIYVRDNGHYRLYGVRTQYFDGHRLKEQRQDFKPYWCFPSLLTEEEQILLKEVVYEDSDKRQLPENRLRHFGKI